MTTLTNQVNHKDRLKSLSDLGVQYIKLGKYELAIKLYQEIEKTAPNLYSTASNIGTAYELNNQIDSALHWIRRGIKLNEKSHGGSEWIHVKILENKKNEAPINIFLFDIEARVNQELKTSSNLTRERILNKIAHQIRTQLKERTFFIKKNDPYVAQLFFDYSIIISEISSLDDALEALKFAKAYGLKSPELIKKEAFLLEAVEKKSLEKTPKHRTYIENYINSSKQTNLNNLNLINKKKNAPEPNIDLAYLSIDEIKNLLSKKKEHLKKETELNTRPKVSTKFTSLTVLVLSVLFILLLVSLCLILRKKF